MKENLSSSSVWSSIGQKLHKNKKNLISVLLFLLLAALTFSAICKGNDMTEVAKAVRKMDVWYLFGAMGLGIFFVSAEGLMICYLLREILLQQAGASNIPLSDFSIRESHRPPQADSRCSSII